MHSGLVGLLQQPIDWLQSYNGAVTSFATVWIAIFTVVLAFVSRRQAALTRDSVRVAERALMSTERAFVFLDDINVDWQVRPRGSSSVEFTLLRVKPRWRNAGTTPTRNMVISVNWTHWPPTGNQTGIGVYDASVPAKVMFLGPRAFEWSEAIKIPGNVATEALEGRQEIIVWGRVEYEDIFENTKPHFTEWCYKLDIAAQSGNITIQPVAFSAYNRSDEDEERKYVV